MTKGSYVSNVTGFNLFHFRSFLLSLQSNRRKPYFKLLFSQIKVNPGESGGWPVERGNLK
jgi:hypothetical protein